MNGLGPRRGCPAGVGAAATHRLRGVWFTESRRGGERRLTIASGLKCHADAVEQRETERLRDAMRKAIAVLTGADGS